MYKQILVPTDGSDLSRAAVRQAIQMARSLNAHLTVLYVQPECPKPLGGEAFTMGPFKEEFLRQSAAAANEILTQAKLEVEQADIRCKCCTATSDEPWLVIIATAKNEGCDLILMASHGRSGLSGLLIGSQTQKVLTHCKVPVLVCR